MTEETHPVRQPDPELDLVLDARSMRALAHPVRIRILGLLRADGPQTSTTLAKTLGLNSGATSYHLRQLAEQGLIQEATDLGSGRERWWRTPSRQTFLNRTLLKGEDDTEAAMAYMRAAGLFYGEHLMRAIEHAAVRQDEWRRVTSFSDFLFLLTHDEASRLVDELHAVLDRYRPLHRQSTEPTPTGARVFEIQLHAYPRETD